MQLHYYLRGSDVSKVSITDAIVFGMGNVSDLFDTYFLPSQVSSELGVAERQMVRKIVWYVSPQS